MAVSSGVSTDHQCRVPGQKSRGRGGRRDRRVDARGSRDPRVESRSAGGRRAMGVAAVRVQPWVPFAEEQVASAVKGGLCGGRRLSWTRARQADNDTAR
jgi:hypothetical protein